MIEMEKAKIIFSIDPEIFWIRFKEAVLKAISEMPTDYIKCEHADADD